MSAAAALTGQQFGRLFVICRVESSIRGKTRWKCLCQCGNYTISEGHNLVSGRAQSCGCISAEKTSVRAKTTSFKHGHTSRGYRSPEYRSWSAMWARCRYGYLRQQKMFEKDGAFAGEHWPNHGIEVTASATVEAA